jgi:hypothetical protein
MRLSDGEITLADWLLDPPGPDELDEFGCYSHDSIIELEAHLIASVEEDLDRLGEPAATVVSMVPDDRWLLISSIQKAIRFGLPDHAAWVASQLYALDRKALHRRLGVIAIEDVLAGDPLATAQALAVLGAMDWRRAKGEERVYCWLARRLAEADGDRSAAELLDAAHSDPRVDFDALDHMDDESLCRIVADPGQPFALRSAVANLLAGPRFALGKIPKTPRSPTRLFRLLVEMGTTRWGCYVAAKTASLVRDPMWVEISIIDRWLRDGTRTIVPGPDFPKPMSGGVLAAALDKHTRPGLQALRQYSKLPQLSRILAGVDPEQRKDALQLGAFYGEGGVVATRVVYTPESQEVYDWIRVGPEFVRWRRPELAPELIPAIRHSLDELNEIRRQVFERTVRGADHAARNLGEIGEEEAR